VGCFPQRSAKTLLPERIGDACQLERRWKLDPALAKMVADMAEWWGSRRTGLKGRFKFFPPLFILSGYRTPNENRAAGGARDSRHLRCPSWAADLRVGNIEGLSNDELWGILGGWWKLHGGRWGGDFSRRDLNHFDLG